MVLSRILAAVKQKVVNAVQTGGPDASLRCIVDAVLAKLDSVCDTDKNVITNLKVRSITRRITV